MVDGDGLYEAPFLNQALNGIQGGIGGGLRVVGGSARVSWWGARAINTELKVLHAKGLGV